MSATIADQIKPARCVVATSSAATVPVGEAPAGAPRARDAYAMAEALPAKGARVCFSGFPREEHDSVRGLLEAHGYLPTAFAVGADAMLVPAASASVIEDAAKTGRQVILREQLEPKTTPAARRPALEIDADTVRILDVTLPRRPEGATPYDSGERFAHLCLDGTFLRAARAVAVAADTALPCALEGDTAVAKTTTVLWVAHLCRQDAIRMNLSGQSDTGELIGRFVPDAGRGATASWRFQEGVMPDAMRHGRWIVLDELNLAEPQILERLNPVLENPPTLVLSENGGERFGPGGDVSVADTFRVFATMNPAEYSGRSVLSPAFRDRFGLWNMLEAPGEAEYRALLDRLVHGVQPEFLHAGIVWKGADGEPVYPRLAACGRANGRLDELLDTLAGFHAAIATAAAVDGAELGRSRRERYVFTRRTLLSMIALVDRLVARGSTFEAALAPAIDAVYLQRVQPGPDRQAIRTALRSAGIVA
jgi:hypothetical protein